MSEVISNTIISDKGKASQYRKSMQARSAINEDVIFNYQTVEVKSLKPTLRITIGEILSNRAVALFLGVLVVIYTALVTARISFDTETQPYDTQLDILEITFLSLFVIELFMRVLAYQIVITI